MAENDSYQAALAQMITGEPAATEPIEPAAQPSTSIEPVQVVTEPATTSPAEPVTPTEEIITSEISLEEPAQATPSGEPDYLGWLKQSFGEDIDSIDALKQKLTPSQPQFANEESKTLYEAFTNGDRKTIKSYIDKIELASSVKEMKPEEVVKAYIKEKNPDFEASEVDAEFSEQFGFDEAKAEDEGWSDSKITREKKKIANRLKEQSVNAQEYFQKYSNVQLPSLDIPAPVSAPQPVETPEAKNAFVFATELNKSLPVDGSSIEFEMKDELLNMKGKVLIPQDKVASIKSKLSGFEDKYIQARYVTKDGSFNEDLFAQDAFFNANRSTIINAAVSDAVHKAHIEWMKKNKNRTDVNSGPTGEFTATDKEAEVALFDQVFRIPPAKKAVV